MRRFPLSDGPLDPDATAILLPESLVRHVVIVLRLGQGERITVFDTLGQQREGTLRQGPKQWHLTELSPLIAPPPTKNRRHLTLLPALCKANRFEWMLEKATELGVDLIAPLTTTRSVIDWSGKDLSKKLARMQRIVEEAARQSGAHNVPRLLPPLPMAQQLARLPTPSPLICFGDPLAQRSLFPLAEDGALAFASGPEGGFTPEECAALIAAGAQAVRLGQQILRAETAPIAVAAALRLAE